MPGKRKREDGTAPSTAPLAKRLEADGSTGLKKRHEQTRDDGDGWTWYGTLLYYRSPGVDLGAKVAAFDFDGCLVNTSLFRKGPAAWSFMFPGLPAPSPGPRPPVFSAEWPLSSWRWYVSEFEEDAYEDYEERYCKLPSLEDSLRTPPPVRQVARPAAGSRAQPRQNRTETADHSVYSATVTRASPYGPHTADRKLFLLVRSGAVTYTADGQSHAARAGDGFSIRPTVTYTVAGNPRGQVSIITDRVLE